jgi:hypothetical protein
MKSQNENSATDQKKKQNSKPYIFAQREGDDFTCIKLTEGKYEGVIYKYNQVKFAPKENEQGQIPLKFTYDIFQNPEKVDVESQDFRFYIGDILVELVEEQLNNGTVKFEK